MKKEKNDIFSRHILLREFGESGQNKLLKSRVCVVGCGGLGCAVLPYLVTSGVGEILLIDKGEIELSNLQRQILYRPDDVGQNKTEIAGRRLDKLSHSTVIEKHEGFIDSGNVSEIISTGFDIVVDCTDNFEIRYLLADYCWDEKIPLVSAAILEYDGHIMSIVNQQDNPCLRCLMPEPPSKYNRASDVGVLGPAVGVMGCLQAVEAVKMLSGMGCGLEKSFLSFDFLSMRVNKMYRDVNPDCDFCAGR